MCIEMAIGYAISFAILKPVALICGIVPHIGWVQDVEFHEKNAHPEVQRDTVISSRRMQHGLGAIHGMRKS
jgi:hypothetical protein